MTDKQICRYTALVARKAEIYSRYSGIHWKPEYGAELEKIAETMGVSLGKAYELIRGMNKELQDAGYLTVSGKVPIKFFEKKYFGFEAEPGAVQKQEGIS